MAVALMSSKAVFALRSVARTRRIGKPSEVSRSCLPNATQEVLVDSEIFLGLIHADQIQRFPGVPAAVRFEAGSRRRHLDEADMDQREEEEGVGVGGGQGAGAAEGPEGRAGQGDIGGRGQL